MRVQRFRDAGAFLDAAGPWLARAEVENNAMIGIARSIADGTRTPKEPPYFAAALDGGSIVCCATQTPPHVLMVTAGPPGALAALAADAFDAFGCLSGVNGLCEPAADFANAWTELAGGRASLRARLRLHRIDRVDAVLPDVRGRLREAAPEERALAVRWYTAFAHEAAPDHPPAAEPTIDLYLETAALYFWDNGAPVTLCARTPVAGRAARVSLVYTPPQFRRHGYATAATAELTRRLLAGGAPYCCLYTDLANPTANGIYARIGYRPVADFDEYGFEGRAGS
jgi:ribosomal protein S18 acetylase RimI-like enzyme